MIRFPPKTILVALDLSKRSLTAWRYAEELRRLTGAAVRGVYVSQRLLPPANGFPAVPPPLSPREKLALRERAARLLGRDDIVFAVTEGGDIAAAIIREAADCGADLIVLATEGRTTLRRLARPSIAEAVARRSPVPVLSLRGPAKAPRSVLAPVSLADYSMSGYRFAEDLAGALDARLTLLHVREGALREAARMRRLELAVDAARAFLSLEAELKTVDGDAVRRILAEAARHDLVVLVAHRKGLILDALLGTTAERVLRRCPVPVLSVPALPYEARRRPTPGALRGRAGLRRRQRTLRARRRSPREMEPL